MNNSTWLFVSAFFTFLSFIGFCARFISLLVLFNKFSTLDIIVQSTILALIFSVFIYWASETIVCLIKVIRSQI